MTGKAQLTHDCQKYKELLSDSIDRLTELRTQLKELTLVGGEIADKFQDGEKIEAALMLRFIRVVGVSEEILEIEKETI